ncbi:MAG: hypothetical protein AB8H80_11410 [Planctomycetota bacterium]
MGLPYALPFRAAARLKTAMKHLIHAILITLVGAFTVAAQSSLTTTFASNASQDGNMFDLIAVNDVTIRYFDIHCDVGTYDFAIYTKSGSYGSATNNPSVWSLVGTATDVVGSGIGMPTALPICIDLFVSAGSRQAFYVTHVPTSPGANVLNDRLGSSAGALFASGPDLEVFEGAGISYPFQAGLGPRIWNGNIYYDGGTGGTPCGGFAAVSSYGLGCGEVRFSSFYEQMSPAAMDLDGQRIRAAATASGYSVDVVAGAGGITPGPTAMVLPLGNDSQVDAAVVGGTLGLWIGSNCWVAFGPGNNTGFAPSASTMLDNPSRAIYAWTDLDPTASFGGSVFYEEAGSVATITYAGVLSWGTNYSNTVQFVIDTASGDFSIEFENLSPLNVEDWLIGYSQSGSSNDPGSADLSAIVGSNALSLATMDSALLALASDRPRLGNTWNLTTREIDPVSPLAVTYFGVRGPAVPLISLGLNAPGCDAHLSTLLGNAGAAVGVSGSATIAVPVPVNAALIGSKLASQSVCLSTQNAANLRTSNGLEGTLGF